MLYHMYEAQRAALAPWRLLAEQGKAVFSHSQNPLSYTTAGRSISAAFDMFEHTTRSYGKPDFGIDDTIRGGRVVHITEELHARKPFGQLRRFKREGDDGNDPRILIVAPMSGHFATLLRGTVKALLPDHDVYITDWRNARLVPLSEGFFNLDDYVDYLVEWLEYLGPNTHVLAVCQPAVPVAGAVALMNAMNHPCTPPTMTLMGGPIDTRIAPTEVNDFAQRHDLTWYEANVISHVPAPHPGAMRRVYPGFMQLAGFMAMNFSNHVRKHYDMFQDLVKGDGESAESTRTFYEEYRAVMDLTSEFYLQTLDVVFCNHQLPRGVWESRGRKIDMKAVEKTAIFVVEGEHDDITGVGQTSAIFNLVKNLKKNRQESFIAPGVGHYGVFNGRVWRNTTAPKLAAFIREFDGANG